MEGTLLSQVTVFLHPFQEGGQGSRALLERAVLRYTGLPAASLGPLETGPFGKPFFQKSPQVQFSITHSGSWWLCAFSSLPIGLDLQIHQSFSDPAKLSRRFFHPLEDAYLAGNDYRDFFDLWCAKESWVKYTGRGFFDDPGSFTLVSPQGCFPTLEGYSFQLAPFDPGYSLCLCTREPCRLLYETL